jgi:hypothetical protein
MKKSLILIMAVALMVFGASLIASAGTAPGTGIGGGAHDLSSGGLSGPDFGFAAENVTGTAGRDRICIYCHAPHHTFKPGDTTTSGVAMNYKPLWNRANSAVASFATYTNGTDEPSDPNHASNAELFANTPGSISMLCLSCHDGSVATNTYGNTPAGPTEIGSGNKFMDSNDRGAIGLGGDLSNHHPIGFILMSSTMKSPVSTFQWEPRGIRLDSSFGRRRWNAVPATMSTTQRT